MPRPVVSGINDLQSQFPEIAAEAYGWDPSTVARSANKKLEWKCPKGHIYSSTVNSRTGKGSGCPFCSGQKVLKGVNDLQTKFPDIAAEAYGWDPQIVSAGTQQKKDWKCKEGHIYSASIENRSRSGSGCPFCSGHRVIYGSNDLQTKFPDIAAEAYGWDPNTIMPKTNILKEWICKKGHIYPCRVSDRTKEDGRGCPFCAGKKVLKGFNDLQTKFPDIAAEAYGWDPSTITGGTPRKMEWKCKKGHIYSSSVATRTGMRTECPFCAGKKVLKGFNDLQTKFPDIAAEAYGWDPSTVVAGTEKKMYWKCKEGHIYSSLVANRTGKGSGCSQCADYGFNIGKSAWFYLMRRLGEQQFGITNDLPTRIKRHKKNGWILLEHTIEGASGKKVQETEALFKKWLKKEIGLIKGTTENWSTTSMEVQSLAELKARSGIETDLF